MRPVLVCSTVLWLASSVAIAQTPTGPHSAGFSPFRVKTFAGSGEFDVVSLIQEDCPVVATVTAADRDDRGAMLTVELTNTGTDVAMQQTLALWVFGPDGTLRGRQQQRQSKALAVKESRHVDLSLRTVPIKIGDRVVVAVQDVTGKAPWRIDLKTLDVQAREALVK
jgi:hypothetical protein